MPCPAQVQAILAQVGRLRPELAAFFACLYYAALRPEEAVALRRGDCLLPARLGEADPGHGLPAHRIGLDRRIRSRNPWSMAADPACRGAAFMSGRS